MREMRHLEMDELLALRDGEGTAYARVHVGSCERCERELDRLHRVRAELRGLPALTPPRELWPGIYSALNRRRRWRRLGLSAGALAAAAALAGLFVARGPADRERALPSDLWIVEASSEDLGPIIERAQELESLLHAYEPATRVYDAPTAFAASVLEDRIMLIDRMLTEGRAVGADRDLLRGLWGERVETLEALVGLQNVRQERVWR